MAAVDLGIFVSAYARPALLQNVLDSLAAQNALANTHVWIDGTAGRSELSQATGNCVAIANGFAPREVRAHRGHLGIEKLMLDGLQFMSAHYDRVLVLEDDCFPSADAIEVFSRALDTIALDPEFYSVYGHPFGIAGEHIGITRFQGWGWASTAEKLVPVVAQLKALFAMSEAAYLEFAERNLTDEVRKRLDITPGRNVTDVLSRFFSWDSATALITAVAGLKHCLTPKRVVYNCGLGDDSGHFSDQQRFRDAPFNMVSPEEVWNFFDASGDAECFPFHGLECLDQRIARFLPERSGTFVELGAFDGVTQSNTLYFERRGWRGVLIEPTPAAFAQCVENRPLAQVFNYACVDKATAGKNVNMTAVGLMSIVDGTRDADTETEWVERGEQLQQLERQAIVVPTRTLADVLAEAGVTAVDLLSLDVEGGEVGVLLGLDLSRLRPHWIVCEDPYDDTVERYLTAADYVVESVLLERAHTRDVLYRDLHHRDVPQHQCDQASPSVPQSAHAELCLNPQRVLGADNLVFDLPTRDRQPLDESTREDLRLVNALSQPFTLQHVDQTLDDCSGSRSANLVAGGWITDARKVDRIHHYVRNLVLETCTPCTASCVFCPVSTNPRRKRRYMDIDLFKLILSRFDDYQLNFVTLNIYNEPLLHPQFLLQAQLLADAGQPLALFTTAAILTPKITDKLAEIGNVDRTVVNCPSTDALEYKRLMGVKIPRNLVANLKHAIDMGMPLQICVNGLTETAERTDAIIAALSEHAEHQPRAFTNYTHNRAGAIQGEENLDDPIWTGELKGCRRAVEDITVNVDGQVLLCCEDFHQDHILGDLRTQSLDEILHSERAVSYRRMVFGLDPAPDDFICRKCAECWRPQDNIHLPATKLL